MIDGRSGDSTAHRLVNSYVSLLHYKNSWRRILQLWQLLIYQAGS